MLDNHPFGHLIAENMKGVIGLTPVHVVHHIAYDNHGDEASLIHQLLHEDGDIKRPIPHTPLFCPTRIGYGSKCDRAFSGQCRL